MLRDALQRWVAAVVTGEVDARAAPRRRLHDPRHERRGRRLRPRSGCRWSAARPRSPPPTASASSPVQVNDIADTRRMLGEQRRLRLLQRAMPLDPARAGGRRVTLWSGRVEAGLAPEVWAFLKADDAELLPYDIAATRIHAGRLHAAGLLTDEELAEVGAARRDRSPTTSTASDEDVHSAIERLLGAGRAARSTPAARATTRSRRRSGSTSRTRAARPWRRSSGSRRRCSTAPRRRRTTPMPGLHAPPARAAGHGRAPPARLGRDARARPLALPLRRRTGGRRRRSAPAPSPARRSRSPLPPNQMRNSLDAVADRDFALDYLYAVRGAATRTSRGSARSSSSGRRASSASSVCRSRRRPARR